MESLVSWMQAIGILCLWMKEESSLKEERRPLQLNCRIEEEGEEAALGVGVGG